MQTVFQAHPLN